MLGNKNARGLGRAPEMGAEGARPSEERASTGGVLLLNFLTSGWFRCKSETGNRGNRLWRVEEAATPQPKV